VAGAKRKPSRVQGSSKSKTGGRRKAKPRPKAAKGKRTFGWGGARPGAGRKPKGDKAGVSHLRRPPLDPRHPVKVVLRLAKGVPNLAQKKAARLVVETFTDARDRLGARLTHFATVDNQVELLVQATDEQALSRAMQGLSIRLARRLNAAFRRNGTVFADRYEAKVIKTPAEARRARAGMRAIK
jgi:hypothetical protein